MARSALSRFQILDQNSLMAPGKCSVCGTCQGTFIDIGLDLDFYGVVYFCFGCIREAANLLEYYSPTQWKSLKELNKIVMEENNDLKDEIEELKKIVDSLGKLSLIRDDSRSVELSMDKKSEHSSSESSKREARLTEQVNESGLSDVPRDDSLDEFDLGDSI